MLLSDNVNSSNTQKFRVKMKHPTLGVARTRKPPRASKGPWGRLGGFLGTPFDPFRAPFGAFRAPFEHLSGTFRVPFERYYSQKSQTLSPLFRPQCAARMIPLMYGVFLHPIMPFYLQCCHVPAGNQACQGMPGNGSCLH